MDPDSSLTDGEVVRRCLDGERSLFEIIVKRYERLVYGVLLRKLPDLALAQDLAQETFLLGFENLTRLRDPERIKSWLMGIASNLVRDYYKRRKTVGIPEGWEGELVGLDPLQSTEQRERHEFLYRAVSRLSPRYRAVLIKRYLEGVSYTDIAEELGISIGAVEVCMHRARKALSVEMREFMPEIDEG